jgi:hypothetical protein
VEALAFLLTRLENAMAGRLLEKTDGIPSATLAGLVRAGATDM